MTCPACTQPMTLINPRAHICHPCQIVHADHPTGQQQLAAVLQGESDR